jgi:GNAT superfamily N-acetyltransferase
MKSGLSNQNVSVEPLSSTTLIRSLILVRQVFPYVSALKDAPAFLFTVSLLPAGMRQRIFSLFGIRDARYWVTTDETGKVIGTTGLYSRREDAGEAVWIGWMCVDSLYRGKGVGKALLEFTITEAKAQRIPFLRLYTSDHPNEEAAQGLYERHNLKIVARFPEGKWTIFHREMRLG